MEQVNFKKNILTLFVLLMPMATYASDVYMDQTSSAVTNSSQFTLEKCALITDMRSGSLIEDPNCVSRNNQKIQQQQAARNGINQALPLNQQSSGVVKPNPPPSPNCGAPSMENAAYTSCMANYNSDVQKYNQQMSIYNQATTSSYANANVSNQNVNLQEAATNKDVTASGSMAEIQNKNNNAKYVYAAGGAVLAGYAVDKFIQAQISAAKCSPTSAWYCTQVPVYMAAGAAFVLLSSQANNQASQHATAANQACVAYNQMSSVQQNCGTAAPSTFTPVTVSSFNPLTGGCKADSPSLCSELSNGKGGINIPKITNGKGISKFVEPSTQFKINPDGSVTTANGKTYKLSDFADQNAMMAAGIPAADAKNLDAMLNGNSGLLSKLGVDAKSELKKGGKPDSNVDQGLALNSGSGLSGAGNSGVASQIFKDSLGPESQRKPSSAGLFKDFNGETIGVSGDDIFSMMNRRYKLKSEQDSFLILGP